MMSHNLQKLIDAKNADITRMRAALAAHTEHMNYLISVFEHDIYSMSIQMQLAEAKAADEDDEEWRSKYMGPENCKNWDCKNWGANKDDCACTAPPVSPEELSPEELSTLPLVASTDALKLKELEERFPGATMVLSTDTKQIEIRHIKIQSRDADMIYWPKMNTYYASFDELGVPVWKRPNLMAEWKGMYIDLTHLFAPNF